LTVAVFLATPLCVWGITRADAGPQPVGSTPTGVAVRGDALQVTDTLPPPLGCNRVAVVGDSLTDNSEPWLISGLEAAGFTALVDAEPSRRISAAVSPPYSGVRAALAMRATWGDADCWVIALGSNDLIRGADDRATATALIEEMLVAVSPGARVWWMNVDYHHDSRTSFDFVAATATFNLALSDRASSDPSFHIIDWYSLAEAHPEWFFDPVHVDRVGSIARAEQIVGALPR
jgi:hypothetical protein